ncbi:hypothetical protein EDD85DRAFT_1017913 [Armillaria nabsnona]|nr:hypothetical protein EDD85DRAFT_1017913 [Armillaria nabsnona]
MSQEKDVEVRVSLTRDFGQRRMINKLSSNETPPPAPSQLQPQPQHQPRPPPHDGGPPKPPPHKEEERDLNIHSKEAARGR